VGGSWNRDGAIVFADNTRGLMQVSAAGGVASPLTTFDPSRKEVVHVTYNPSRASYRSGQHGWPDILCPQPIYQRHRREYHLRAGNCTRAGLFGPYAVRRRVVRRDDGDANGD
jgi:hypothetical protein